MGAQIAAHLVSARVDVLLYDLPAKEGPPNAGIERAIDGLRKLKPAPLAHPDLADWIVPANYDDDLERLAECDLVIERSEEHTSELQSRPHLVCRLLLEKKKRERNHDSWCSRGTRWVIREYR